jgi:hypothetical protein
LDFHQLLAGDFYIALVGAELIFSSQHCEIRAYHLVQQDLLIRTKPFATAYLGGEFICLANSNWLAVT